MVSIRSLVQVAPVRLFATKPATSDVGGVQTLELYRMTQFGVVDMTSELVLANSTALLCDSVLGAVFLGLVLHA